MLGKYSTAELVEEVARRSEAMVFLGINNIGDAEDPDGSLDFRVHGNNLTLFGMLNYALQKMLDEIDHNKTIQGAGDDPIV